MKRTVTLKLNKEFKRLYYQGKSAVFPHIVVYVLPNRKSLNRIGLTCGKSVGKAVKRNRVKRLMRESYRLIEDNIKMGYDIVIVARNKSVNCKFIIISDELKQAFIKLGLLEKDGKNSNIFS